MLKIKIIDVYHAVVHNHSLHVSPLNGETYYRTDSHKSVGRQPDKPKH